MYSNTSSDRLRCGLPSFPIGEITKHFLLLGSFSSDLPSVSWVYRLIVGVLWLDCMG